MLSLDGLAMVTQWLYGWTVTLDTMYDFNTHFPLDPGEANIS